MPLYVVTMDYFTDVFTTFLGLVSCNNDAAYVGSETSQISSKIY